MSRSIMQNKDGCCYMCDLLGTWQQGYTIEEHHCFGGPNRKLSEKYGLKVYLCPEHHRTGPDAVHQNSDYMQILHEAAQKAFEERYPDKSFREIFGKNYI